MKLLQGGIIFLLPSLATLDDSLNTVNLINKNFPSSSLLIFRLRSTSRLHSAESYTFPILSLLFFGKENSIGMKMFFQFKYLNFINSHNDVAEFKSVKRSEEKFYCERLEVEES